MKQEKVLLHPSAQSIHFIRPHSLSKTHTAQCEMLLIVTFLAQEVQEAKDQDD